MRHDHARMRFAAGVLALAAMLAALVVALGGGAAFWLCVPAVLAVCAGAQCLTDALAATAAVALAAAVPELASASLGPGPPVLAAPAVVGASAGVLLALRRRVEAEHARLRRWALRDPLTGLANRRALDERIAYEVARHTRHERPLAVLALDLDGFKAVNDRFGHDAGDELLRDVAAALTSVVRAQDTVARLGGDEFCVVAPETGRDGARCLAERVAHAVRRAGAGLDGVSASVGGAVFPEDGESADALLAAADAAAIAVKRRRAARRADARRAA